MIKFVIKVNTKDDLVLTGGEQEAPSEDVFNTFIDGLYKSIGTGNFMLTDEDGDIMIIPQALISQSVVQVIKTN
jgi:hypothetical protein